MNLYVSKSANGGASWTTTTLDISSSPPDCSAYSCGWAYLGAQLTVASDAGGNLYALWNAGKLDKAPERVYFARSLDAGATWSPKLDVSAAPAGTAHAFPAIAAGVAGDVRIFLDGRAGGLALEHLLPQLHERRRHLVGRERPLDLRGGFPLRPAEWFQFPLRRLLRAGHRRPGRHPCRLGRGAELRQPRLHLVREGPLASSTRRLSTSWHGRAAGSWAASRPSRTGSTTPPTPSSSRLDTSIERGVKLIERSTKKVDLGPRAAVRQSVAAPDPAALDTRERLVAVAMRLFADEGYLSTSVADILKEAGAHSGSLYHFFPTKQDLLIAVLERYLGGIEAMLLAPAWRGVPDPLERVFALLAAYRRLLKASDCRYGCPIGNLALEIHEPDPGVREKLAANFEAWVDAVELCLQAAGPRLPRDVDRRELAVFVLSTMEGGVMQARTHRSLAPFDACIARLRDYFARLEAARSPGRRRREKGKGK